MSAKREAKDFERTAKRRESGKGEFSSPLGKIHYHDPFSVAKDYEFAARKWITARNPKKAYEDYSKAAKVYSNAAESEQRHIRTAEGFISNKHQIRYEAAREKSEEARRNAERLKKVLAGKWNGLTGKTIAAIVIVSLIGGIFFLSTNITGNAIKNLTISTSSIIGAGLVVVGLGTGFYYFKNRK